MCSGKWYHILCVTNCMIHLNFKVDFHEEDIQIEDLWAIPLIDLCSSHLTVLRDGHLAV